MKNTHWQNSKKKKDLCFRTRVLTLSLSFRVHCKIINFGLSRMNPGHLIAISKHSSVTFNVATVCVCVRNCFCRMWLLCQNDNQRIEFFVTFHGSLFSFTFSAFIPMIMNRNASKGQPYVSYFMILRLSILKWCVCVWFPFISIDLLLFFTLILIPIEWRWHDLWCIYYATHTHKQQLISVKRVKRNEKKTFQWIYWRCSTNFGTENPLTHLTITYEKLKKSRIKTSTLN